MQSYLLIVAVVAKTPPKKQNEIQQTIQGRSLFHLQGRMLGILLEGKYRGPTTN